MTHDDSPLGRPRQSSLKSKISSSIAAALAAMGLLAAIILAGAAHLSATRIEAPRRIESLTAFMTGSLQAPLWNIDPRSAQVILDSSRIDPAIVSVSLFNEQGEIFGKFSRGEDSKGAPLRRSAPLTSPMNRSHVIGRLEIVYDSEPIASQSYVAAGIFAALMAIFAIASGLAMRRLLAKHVADPVALIAQHAARIGAGALSEPVPVVGDALETQELSRALEATRLRISGLISGLETQVAARTEELQTAMEGLRQAQDTLIETQKFAALGGLVAGVAHDLNTPIGNARMALSTASHYAGILRQGLASGSLAKKSEIEKLCLRIEESCQLAESNAARSADLVSSFMRLAIDRASERRRSFDLRETVREVLSANMPSLRPARISILDAALQPGIIADSYPGTLGQIVGNLLDNARTHGFDGAEGGRIALGCALDPKDRSFALLWIADDGLGIDPSHIKRVFEPFYTTKVGKGGNGLGLANVSNLATKVLGGAAKIQSPVPREIGELLFGEAVSRGALVEIRMPLSAPQDSEHPHEPPSPPLDGPADPRG